MFVFPGIHPRVAIGSWTKRPTNILEIFIFRFFVGWDGCCNGAPLTKKLYQSHISPSPSRTRPFHRGWSRTSANIVRKAYLEFGNAWFGLGVCGIPSLVNIAHGKIPHLYLGKYHQKWWMFHCYVRLPEGTFWKRFWHFLDRWGKVCS